MKCLSAVIRENLGAITTVQYVHESSESVGIMFETFWKIAVERVAVVKFGVDPVGSDGTGC